MPITKSGQTITVGGKKFDLFQSGEGSDSIFESLDFALGHMAGWASEAEEKSAPESQSVDELKDSLFSTLGLMTRKEMWPEENWEAHGKLVEQKISGYCLAQIKGSGVPLERLYQSATGKPLDDDEVNGLVMKLGRSLASPTDALDVIREFSQPGQEGEAAVKWIEMLADAGPPLSSLYKFGDAITLESEAKTFLKTIGRADIQMPTSPASAMALLESLLGDVTTDLLKDEARKKMDLYTDLMLQAASEHFGIDIVIVKEDGSEDIHFEVKSKISDSIFYPKDKRVTLHLQKMENGHFNPLLPEEKEEQDPELEEAPAEEEELEDALEALDDPDDKDLADHAPDTHVASCAGNKKAEEKEPKKQDPCDVEEIKITETLPDGSTREFVIVPKGDSRAQPYKDQVAADDKTCGDKYDGKQEAIENLLKQTQKDIEKVVNDFRRDAEGTLEGVKIKVEKHLAKDEPIGLTVEDDFKLLADSGPDAQEAPAEPAPAPKSSGMILESGAVIEIAAPQRPFFMTTKKADKTGKFTKIKLEVKIDSPCKDKAHPRIIVEEKGEGSSFKTSQNGEKTFEFPVFPNASLETLDDSADLTELMDRLHTKQKPNTYRIEVESCGDKNASPLKFTLVVYPADQYLYKYTGAAMSKASQSVNIKELVQMTVMTLEDRAKWMEYRKTEAEYAAVTRDLNENQLQKYNKSNSDKLYAEKRKTALEKELKALEKQAAQAEKKSSKAKDAQKEAATAAAAKAAGDRDAKKAELDAFVKATYDPAVADFENAKTELAASRKKEKETKVLLKTRKKEADKIQKYTPQSLKISSILTMLDNASEHPERIEFNLLETLKSRNLLYGDFWEEEDAEGKVNIDLSEFELLESYITGMDKVNRFKKIHKTLMPGQSTPSETTTFEEDTGTIPDASDDPLDDVVIPIPDFQNFKGMSIKLSTVLKRNDEDKVHSPILMEGIDSLNQVVTEMTRYMLQQYKETDPLDATKRRGIWWSNPEIGGMDLTTEIRHNQGKVIKHWGWKEYDHRVYMSENLDLDLIPIYLKLILAVPLKIFVHRNRRAVIVVTVEGQVSYKFSYSVENPIEEKIGMLDVSDLAAYFEIPGNVDLVTNSSDWIEFEEKPKFALKGKLWVESRQATDDEKFGLAVRYKIWPEIEPLKVKITVGSVFGRGGVTIPVVYAPPGAGDWSEDNPMVEGTYPGSMTFGPKKPPKPSESPSARYEQIKKRIAAKEEKLKDVKEKVSERNKAGIKGVVAAFESRNSIKKDLAALEGAKEDLKRLKAELATAQSDVESAQTEVDDAFEELGNAIDPDGLDAAWAKLEPLQVKLADAKETSKKALNAWNETAAPALEVQKRSHPGGEQSYLKTWDEEIAFLNEQLKVNERMLQALIDDLKNFAGQYPDEEKRSIELLFSLLIQKEYFDSNGPEGQYVKGRLAAMEEKHKSWEEISALNKELNNMEWTHSLILKEISEKESEIEAKHFEILELKRILEERNIKHHIINSKAEKAKADGVTVAALKTDMNNLNKQIKKAENELKKLRDELKALHNKNAENDKKLHNMLKKKDALVTGDVVALHEVLAKEGEPLRAFLVGEMGLSSALDEKLVTPEVSGLDIAKASLDRERDRLMKMLDDQSSSSAEQAAVMADEEDKDAQSPAESAA